MIKFPLKQNNDQVADKNRVQMYFIKTYYKQKNLGSHGILDILIIYVQVGSQILYPFVIQTEFFKKKLFFFSITKAFSV